MGLFWNRKKKEPELRDNSHCYYSDSFLFGSNLRENNAMCLSAVYRATELISDSIATLPIAVKLKQGHHELEQEKHPLMDWFTYGSLLSKYTTMKLLIQSVILKGNGFARIVRDNQGNVKDIIFVEANDVVIYFDKYKRTLLYSVTGVPGKIEPINMIHLVKNTYDGVNGVSVLRYGSRTLDISNATENTAKNYFANGGNLAGILTIDGSVTKQQRQDAKNSFVQSFSDGGSGIAVLQGNMHYQQIQSNAEEAQLLQERVYNIQDIARFFGVSPILLGDLTKANQNAIEAIQLDFLQHTLQPYIVMIEQEFNRKLLKPSEKHLTIDLDDSFLLKADKSALASYYSTFINNGVMTPNEVRAALGLPRCEEEGMDDHYMPFSDRAKTAITGNPNNTKNNDENKLPE